MAARVIFLIRIMRPTQYLRIYNLTFAVIAACVFFLALRPAEGLFDRIVLQSIRSEAERKGQELEHREYESIRAAEGIAKAREFQRSPKITVIYPDYLRMLEQRKGILSALGLVIALVGAYFLVLKVIVSAVRYVTNAPMEKSGP